MEELGLEPESQASESVLLNTYFDLHVGRGSVLFISVSLGPRTVPCTKFELNKCSLNKKMDGLARKARGG